MTKNIYESNQSTTLMHTLTKHRKVNSENFNCKILNNKERYKYAIKGDETV